MAVGDRQALRRGEAEKARRHCVEDPARQLPAGADRKPLAEETGALARRLVAGLNAGRAPEALLAEADAPPPAGEAARR